MCMVVISWCEIITLKRIFLLSPDYLGQIRGTLPAIKIDILLFWGCKIRKAQVPSCLIDFCPSEAWFCLNVWPMTVLREKWHYWTAHEKMGALALLPPLFRKWAELPKKGRWRYGRSSVEGEQESKADRKQVWSLRLKRSSCRLQSALCLGRVSDDQRGGVSWTSGKPDHLQHLPGSSARSDKPLPGINTQGSY